MQMFPLNEKLQYIHFQGKNPVIKKGQSGTDKDSLFTSFTHFSTSSFFFFLTVAILYILKILLLSYTVEALSWLVLASHFYV